MQHTRIDLTADGRVSMVTYIHGTFSGDQEKLQPEKRPAIIILPGGAYGFLSETEAEPVALTFLKEGFNTFVLYYSVGEESVYPNPLDDVSKAILQIRNNAQKWKTDPDAVAVMGFSAGAGIAALSATQWNDPDLAGRLGVPSDMLKPNAAVLGYGAARNSTIVDDPDVYKPPILGKIARDGTPQLDFPDYVGPHTCPMFIWCTREDAYVPQVNSELWIEMLNRYNLPYEMHIFGSGHHGMSVCNTLSSYGSEDLKTSVPAWVPLCTSWLRRLFNF